MHDQSKRCHVYEIKAARQRRIQAITEKKSSANKRDAIRKAICAGIGFPSKSRALQIIAFHFLTQTIINAAKNHHIYPGCALHTYIFSQDGILVCCVLAKQALGLASLWEKQVYSQIRSWTSKSFTENKKWTTPSFSIDAPEGWILESDWSVGVNWFPVTAALTQGWV